jgi:antitoxin component YwqK of YwqJK toxin-antitoxin module
MSIQSRETTGPTPHTEYHKDGSITAKGNVMNGLPEGYWEWFRKDGSKMLSGYFNNGTQVDEWITYARTGATVKVTKFK